MQVVPRTADRIGEALNQGAFRERGQRRKAGPGHDLGGLTGETAPKGTQCGGDRPIDVTEPLPGAAENGVHAAMTGLDRRAGRLRVDALRQARQEIARRDNANPAGRQLDGERQPLQLLADLADRIGVGLGEGVRGRGRDGPIDEEVDRLVGHRRDDPHLLIRYSESDAAGRQNPRARALAKQAGGHLGASRRHVFAVVQDHQGPTAAEGVDHRKKCVGSGRTRETQRGGNVARDIGRVHYRPERHPIDVLVSHLRGSTIAEPLCHLDGQTRLAQPAHTADSQQTSRRKGDQSSEFTFPADEAREIGGQPIGEQFLINGHASTPKGQIRSTSRRRLTTHSPPCAPPKSPTARELGISAYPDRRLDQPAT